MPLPTPAHLPNSQRGIAQFPIIIAVIAVVVVIASGYFFINKNKTNPVADTVAKIAGLNPNCEYNDPDLCKFVNNWKTISTYSVKSTMTGPDSAKTESTFEIAGEDRVHIAVSEGGKETWQVITIGDTTYTKDFSDNKWWKKVQEKEKESLAKQFEFKFEDEHDASTPAEHSHTTYKSVGKEACGKMQCFKYQVIEPDFADITEYIWFDDKDYLLRRQMTEDKANNSTSDTSFTYDKVNIDVPSPVKDAKPDQVIIPGGGTMDLNTQEMKQMQVEMEKMMQNAGENNEY